MNEFGFTDTHCHLNFSSFENDRETVIRRARDIGLARILNPAIDIDTSRAVLSLADQFPEVFVAVGVHPNSATSWTDTSLSELIEISKHPKVVAIGEIGLDYYRLGAPAELQRVVFSAQLELAAKLELPVIIHNRDASADVKEILTAWIGSMAENKSKLLSRPGVLHSFSGNLEMARWAVVSNYYIGITGPVTYKNATQLQQITVEIPLERTLIETDSPFLPPHPHRGKRNEPAHVAIIAGKIAELRNIDESEVVISTSRNAAHLFRWREID